MPAGCRRSRGGLTPPESIAFSERIRLGYRQSSRPLPGSLVERVTQDERCGGRPVQVHFAEGGRTRLPLERALQNAPLLLLGSPRVAHPPRVVDGVRTPRLLTSPKVPRSRALLGSTIPLVLASFHWPGRLSAARSGWWDPGRSRTIAAATWMRSRWGRRTSLKRLRADLRARGGTRQRHCAGTGGPAPERADTTAGDLRTQTRRHLIRPARRLQRSGAGNSQAFLRARTTVMRSSDPGPDPDLGTAPGRCWVPGRFIRLGSAALGSVPDGAHRPGPAAGSRCACSGHGLSTK